MEGVGEGIKERRAEVSMKESKVCFSSQFIRFSVQYVNFRVRVLGGRKEPHLSDLRASGQEIGESDFSSLGVRYPPSGRRWAAEC